MNMKEELVEFADDSEVISTLVGAALAVPDRLSVDGIAPSLLSRLRSVVDAWSSFHAGRKTALADRFNWLAAVAQRDLVLAKLFESHLDALQIMQELRYDHGSRADEPRGGRTEAGNFLWGVWAAQGPSAVPLTAWMDGSADAAPPDLLPRLSGRKSWCSGAALLDAALVTAADGAGGQRLFAVDLRQPGVTVTEEGWNAVGMAATASVDVVFDKVPAFEVGEPAAYLQRPGFWHGAAGIAACWHGAACGLAMPLLERVAVKVADSQTVDALLSMHLGQVDSALSGSALALTDAVRRIEAHRAGGDAFGQREALRLRAIVEAAATAVMTHVGHGLGAAPLCRNAAHAGLAADLPVFLRQSHAEWDLAVQGTLAARAYTATAKGAPPWPV